LRYATCVFAIPDDAPSDWKGVMTFGEAPHMARGALMLPLEGNGWMVTVAGYHGDVPPGDAEGFLQYARALRTPTIYNAIIRAKRPDGVARYGFPQSVWRHFERFDVFEAVFQLLHTGRENPSVPRRSIESEHQQLRVLINHELPSAIRNLLDDWWYRSGSNS
jgi:hypothetical protein